jgi:hypothetical protein
MVTKKQFDVIRKEAELSLYENILLLDYSIDDMFEFREYFRENATDITKDINKAKRKLKILISKYESITGIKYKPRKAK